MKNFSFLFLGLFFISSCTDPCKDIECLNDGVCEEGVCNCPTGYRGIRCESEIRTYFISDWNTVFNCTNEEDFGETTTSFTRDENNILGVKWSVIGIELLGVVDIERKIKFELDTIYPDGETLAVFGFGDEFGDVMTIFLNIRNLDTEESYVCDFDLTK